MSLEEGFRDHIATVNDKGKRIWIFPKKPSGTFYNYRKIVSYFLLAFLFLAPHLKIGGKQLLLFNILERKFILFGSVFWPQDFWIFALVMVLGIVFIIFFTIIFGRLFCGWVCPQTIFMEMLFRRIEYWIEGDARQQQKLDSGPWTFEKIRKKTLKHFIYIVFSVIIAHFTMAYIIGIEETINIVIYFPMLALPLTGIWCLFDFTVPIGIEWLILLTIGIFTQIAQVCMTRAFLSTDTAIVAPFQYIGAIYALFSGWFIFDEKLELASIIGVCLVIFGVIVGTIFRAGKKRKKGVELVMEPEAKVLS